MRIGDLLDEMRRNRIIQRISDISFYSLLEERLLVELVVVFMVVGILAFVGLVLL